MTAEQIRERLREVKYPGFSRDIVSFGIVKDIAVGPEHTEVSLEIVTENHEVREAIVAEVEKLLAGVPDLPEPIVHVEQPQRRGAAQARQMASAMGRGPSRPAGVQRVVAVASGKGGVGKSTVAANLAVALSRAGASVGLLDADIYGPSLPTLFGLGGERQPVDDGAGRLLPLERHGVKLVSMGFFVGRGAPLIWRGPMLGKALGQFLEDVDWGALDYLVLDLPPGTGDVQMTLTQTLKIDGGVIVTTPQEVALADVERGVKMFEQADTPVLGVVENMSFHLCPGCGERAAIFGEGGGERVAARFGVPLLARVPLVRSLREAGDSGRPPALEDSGEPGSEGFAALAAAVREVLEQREEARA